MMFVDPKEHPMSIQILVGLKKHWFKLPNLSTRIRLPISSISIWAARLTRLSNRCRCSLAAGSQEVYEMVSYVTDAVKKPVTVKMRTGWDKDHIFAVENALAAEKLELLLWQCMAEPESKCMRAMLIGTF